MAQRSKSSPAWLHEHVNDPYVKRAQKDGYRARAAYKLLEINEKDKLIKQGTILADLGSAPGSWSQIAAKLVGKTGKVFALDILPMDALDGVDFIQGDFREEAVLAEFESLLDNRPLENRRRVFSESVSRLGLSRIHGSHARSICHGANAQTRCVAQSV